jgi:hypothetical protein
MGRAAIPKKLTTSRLRIIISEPCFLEFPAVEGKRHDSLFIGLAHLSKSNRVVFLANIFLV